MKVTCPSCEKVLSAPDSAAGKTGKCSGCGTRFVLRSSQPPPVPIRANLVTAAADPAPAATATVPIPVGQPPVEPRNKEPATVGQQQSQEPPQSGKPVSRLGKADGTAWGERTREFLGQKIRVNSKLSRSIWARLNPLARRFGVLVAVHSKSWRRKIGTGLRVTGGWLGLTAGQQGARLGAYWAAVSHFLASLLGLYTQRVTHLEIDQRDKYGFQSEKEEVRVQLRGGCLYCHRPAVQASEEAVLPIRDLGFLLLSASFAVVVPFVLWVAAHHAWTGRHVGTVSVGTESLIFKELLLSLVPFVSGIAILSHGLSSNRVRRLRVSYRRCADHAELKPILQGTLSFGVLTLQRSDVNDKSLLRASRLQGCSAIGQLECTSSVDRPPCVALDERKIHTWGVFVLSTAVLAGMLWFLGPRFGPDLRRLAPWLGLFALWSIALWIVWASVLRFARRGCARASHKLSSAEHRARSLMMKRGYPALALDALIEVAPALEEGDYARLKSLCRDNSNLSTRRAAVAAIADLILDHEDPRATDPNALLSHRGSELGFCVGSQAAGQIQFLMGELLELWTLNSKSVRHSVSCILTHITATAVRKPDLLVPCIVDTLTVALGDSTPGVRQSAAELLGILGNDALAAIGQLTKLVTDRYPIMRAAASIALAAIDPLALAAAVTSIPKRIPNSDQRIARIRMAINAYRPPAEITQIKTRIASRNQSIAHARTGKQQKSQGGTGGAFALSALLTGAMNPVQALITGALYQRMNNRETAEERKERESRLAALEGEQERDEALVTSFNELSRLRLPLDFPALMLRVVPLIEAETDEELLILAHSTDEGDRRLAALLLGEEIGAAFDERLQLLDGLLRSDESAAVRELAAVGLGYLGTESDTAVTSLLDALRQDSDFAVRRSAAAALGSINLPKLAPHFLNALNDSDGDIRWRLAHALLVLAGSTPEGAPRVLSDDQISTVLGVACEAVPADKTDRLPDELVVQACGDVKRLSRESLPFFRRYLRSSTGVQIAVPLLDKLSAEDRSEIIPELKNGATNFRGEARKAATAGLKQAAPDSLTSLNSAQRKKLWINVAGTAAVFVGLIALLLWAIKMLQQR